MTGFALFNRVISLPDLNALGSGPQLKMITAASNRAFMCRFRLGACRATSISGARDQGVS